jgi:Guanosine polyphosphate pyrophosphohydrolases/synthetases
VLQHELDKVDIPAEISGRAKHFYSIYDKMVRKGREFNEIYDLTAMRVIVERGGDEGRATATARSADPLLGSRCPAASRTSSRCRSSTRTARCTRR